MRKGSGEETGGPHTDKKDAVLESAPKPKRHTRIEQAEARTEQAEAQTEQANTRTEQAEMRTVAQLNSRQGQS